MIASKGKSMSHGKYRPFIVALTVSLIWIIYIFFYNINWQEYVMEELVSSARAEVLPVTEAIGYSERIQLSWLQRLVSSLIPCYGYAISQNQDVVAINMISGEKTTLENDNTLSDNKRHPDAADGNAAASEGLAVQDAVSRKTSSGTVYNRADLYNNDFLRSHFYTVTSITSLDDSILRGEEFLNRDLSISHDATTPQILIFHTHSQEAFADSIEGDVNTSIVGVGNYLTKLLTSEYGYNVIHDTSAYDFVDGTLDRSKAYTYAEAGVQAILDVNPSIEVVIDLHRDGVADTTHLVTDMDGKQMAKIMFFNGVSYSNNVGNIDYLYNPNRDENLAMSLQMQLLGEAYYPGFLRNIYINAYRYCLHMRGKSMLIEAGAQTNTVQEEMNAMEPLADMLDKLLKGEKAY